MKNEPFQVTLKKIFNNLFKKSSKRLYQHDPQGDWTKILVVSFLIGIALVIMCAYFFYKISNGDFFIVQNANSTGNEIFNKSLFKQENDYYNVEEKKFNDLRSQVWNGIDPSI